MLHIILTYIFLLDICLAIEISEIQGNKWLSPFKGQQVTNIIGVVTAKDKLRGFYMQDPTPSHDPTRSSGIFVYTNTANVQVGDTIRINSAIVSEYKNPLKKDANSGTQLTKSDKIEVLSVKNSVKPVRLENVPSRVIYGSNPFSITDSLKSVEDLNAPLNLTRGLDYFESLEGMLVTILNPVAVSATSRYGGFWVSYIQSNLSLY